VHLTSWFGLNDSGQLIHCGRVSQFLIPLADMSKLENCCSSAASLPCASFSAVRTALLLASRDARAIALWTIGIGQVATQFSGNLLDDLSRALSADERTNSDSMAEFSIDDALGPGAGTSNEAPCPTQRTPNAPSSSVLPLLG